MSILRGDDPAAVLAAAQRLADGQLVAFPTETVYGLGARADDDAAVARIFAAKGRPADHPLIVHLGQASDVAEFAASVSPAAQRLMLAFWPGPLTVILPRRPGRAAAAAGGQDSIGLRMPAHPVALALLREAARLGVAGVAAPSANRFGRISPTLAMHVQQEFDDSLWVLDGGACAVGIESAIVDCRGAAPALLRPGQLGRARIEAVLGQAVVAADAQSPRASGTLASHYAPRARLQMFDPTALAAGAPPPWAPAHSVAGGQALPAQRPNDRAAQGAGVYSRAEPVRRAGAEESQRCLHWRRMPDQADAVAQQLFAVLRELDSTGVAVIWVERPPADSAWDGVRDRLQRASA
jgi:L-threonylcarbamoyladenylate synthase